MNRSGIGGGGGGGNGTTGATSTGAHAASDLRPRRRRRGRSALETEWISIGLAQRSALALQELEPDVRDRIGGSTLSARGRRAPIAHPAYRASGHAHGQIQ